MDELEDITALVSGTRAERVSREECVAAERLVAMAAWRSLPLIVRAQAINDVMDVCGRP